MTRTAPARPRRRPSGKGGTTLGALLALALVTTAAAPSLLTVQRGDTLWDLARSHGTSVDALKALNSLRSDTIYAGQTLRIGGDAAPARTSSGGTHRVSRGDTLSEIALRYGVSQSAIASANGLSGARIYAGTTLTIPGGASSAAGVPTSNAGAPTSDRARSSVAENRRVLAARSHPSKAQVRQMVAATARRHGVPPSLAVAVAYQESGFQQRVVSGANAIGVMQVLPSTGRVLARQHGISLDLLDPQDNITAGVLLLRQLLRSEGTDEGALAGYYQGLGSIARKGLLPQTHAYLRNIDALRDRFPNG